MKKIKIVSPAKAIDAERIDFAVSFLESNGFIVEISENAKGKYHYFSGTDKKRRDDFQNALDDETIDFILCSRGGYGSVRIIDDLNFDKFIKNPKPIIGYSDITVFHNHIHTNFGVETVHATSPLNFKENTKESLDSLLRFFKGEKNKYSFNGNNWNRKGRVEKLVVGGNLSIIASLVGTNSDLDLTDKILFFEDIGEAVYAVDRMMQSLKKSEKLNNLAGLIIGGMTNMKDSDAPFGATVEEVIYNSVKDYDFPVCFNFPAGHIADNRLIVLGRSAKLNISDDNVTFEQ